MGRLTALPKTTTIPLADRGRMLFIRDVIDLLKGRKGEWWVRNCFAPEYKRKLGRDPYQLETSLPGVFAAGDGRSRSVKRVASAVGEGSIAIRLASEHLSRRS